jgi:hypothetical protein
MDKDIEQTILKRRSTDGEHNPAGVQYSYPLKKCK